MAARPFRLQQSYRSSQEDGLEGEEVAGASWSGCPTDLAPLWHRPTVYDSIQEIPWRTITN
jgi:hypothetical protein